MIPKIPKFLYQYSRLKKLNKGDKHYLEGEVTYREERIFTKNKIYFRSPKQFNDPYDCRLPTMSFDASDEEWIAEYSKQMPAKVAKQRIREGHHKDLEHQKIFLKRFQKKIFKLGVLCLSEVPDSILMWSHYADGHKGFCLQFDNTEIRAEKVNYSRSYPEINYIRTPDEEQFDLTLLTKFKGWCYEQEWRIIEYENSYGTCNFPKEKITGVILGAEMLPEHKKMIGKWLEGRKPSVQVYEASKKIGLYGVDIPGLNSH